MAGSRALLVVVGVLLVAACSAGGESAPKTPPTYRPGQSLHSTMCSCRACSKPDCCGGAEEPEAGEGKRCEGYDFGVEGCGISVASCTSRCYEEIWRVPRGKDCADKRPQICCEPSSEAS